jgi:hypothetical protein
MTMHQTLAVTPPPFECIAMRQGDVVYQALGEVELHLDQPDGRFSFDFA